MSDRATDGDNFFLLVGTSIDHVGVAGVGTLSSISGVASSTVVGLASSLNGIWVQVLGQVTVFITLLGQYRAKVMFIIKDEKNRKACFATLPCTNTCIEHASCESTSFSHSI